MSSKGSGGSGAATGAGSRVDVTLKLSQLQNFCKRDPEGYRDDYDAQARRLASLAGILSLSPSADPSPRLVELIQFAAAVSSSSYKGKESDRIADLLVELLVGSTASAATTAKNASVLSTTMMDISSPVTAMHLHRDVRKTCVSALILMRNKGAVPPLRLLELFFKLMAVVPDKNLREALHHHMVNDLKNINKKGKREEKVNRSVQTFMHRVVSSSATRSSTGGDDGPAEVAAKRATDITCELYRRGVWTDERAVSILAAAAGSANASVAARALRFFLNIEEKMATDKKIQEEGDWEGAQGVDMHLHSKKTRAKKRLIGKQIRNRQRKQTEREYKERYLYTSEDKGVDDSKKLFPAIELLRDPQGLAETILRRIKSSGSNTYKFEVKTLMVNFVTRVVGNHELLVLPLYPYLQRYMGGHQRDVTAILAYTVQACHEYVPPEEIHGILKTIAHNFITERCSGEQMAVGINAVRSICARVPSVLAEQGDASAASTSSAWDVEAFARDLAGYAKHRDRSVSIAGRGWTNFIREVHPSLLQGKDRGSVGSALHRAGEKPLQYGEVRAASGVKGADLLVAYEDAMKNKALNPEGGDGEGSDDDNDGEWEEVAMDEEDGEGGGDGEDGWVDMEEDGDGGSAEDKDTKKNQDGKADNDDEAPDLVLLDETKAADGDDADEEDAEKPALDLTKLSAKERANLQQQVSSTRIFSTADFVKMQKLVDRQERARRDPRAATKLKRAIAKGEEYDDMSDDDSVDSDDEDIHVAGAVNPIDIMANAKRKRISKAEKLEKIIEGRDKWESKGRAGGSTNTEKKRKKIFNMSKFSFDTRKKLGEKTTAKQGKRRAKAGLSEGRKRRRKV